MAENEVQAGSQDVERIRDIIFGTQMHDYKQQFGALQRDVARLQHEIDQLNEQLAEQDSKQGKKAQALRRDMRKADADLRSELRDTAQRLTSDKVDRVKLGRLFLEIGNNLTEGLPIDEESHDLVEGEHDSDRAG